MSADIPLVSTTNMLILKGDEALFIKRSEKLENFPGWYMLPGGKQEHDETPMRAAIIETFEETGLKVIKPQLKVVATHFHEYKPKVYLVFIYLAREFSGRLIEKSEEGELIWLSVNKILEDPKLYPDLKRHFRLIFEGDGQEVIFTYHRFNKDLEIIETL